MQLGFYDEKEFIVDVLENFLKCFVAYNHHNVGYYDNEGDLIVHEKDDEETRELKHRHEFFLTELRRSSALVLKESQSDCIVVPQTPNTTTDSPSSGDLAWEDHTLRFVLKILSTMWSVLGRNLDNEASIILFEIQW